MKLQIAIDGNSYELDVEVIEDDEAPNRPFSGGSYYPLVPSTVHSGAAPAVRGHAAAQEEGGDEDKLCRSPVTGIVIKVNVAPGQAIAEHELIMVLEAMKMETNVIAQRAGTVKSVRVAAGDSVKVNQVVIELE